MCSGEDCRIGQVNFVWIVTLNILAGSCWREGGSAEPAAALEECLRGAQIRAGLL